VWLGFVALPVPEPVRTVRFPAAFSVYVQVNTAVVALVALVPCRLVTVVAQSLVVVIAPA